MMVAITSVKMFIKIIGLIFMFQSISCCEVLHVDHFTENSCPSLYTKSGPLTSEILCANVCTMVENCLSFTYNRKTLNCRGHVGKLLPSNCEPGQPDDAFYVLRCNAAILGSSCNSSQPCFVDDIMRCHDDTCTCETGYTPTADMQTCT